MDDCVIADRLDADGTWRMLQIPSAVARSLEMTRTSTVAFGWRPAAIMLALAAISAMCFVVIKAGLLSAPPLLFGGLRTLIGGVALLGLMVSRHQPVIPNRRIWPWILLLALPATTVTYGAMFLSAGRMGAGIATVLSNTQPLFIVVLAAIVASERITSRTLLALLLGGLGTTLIASSTLLGSDAHGAAGAVLALAASVGAAAGSVIVKRMGQDSAILLVTAWQLVIGSIPLLIASAIVERGTTVTWTVEFLSLLLFLALVGTSVATAVWYGLIQRYNVGHLSVFLFLVPVFGLAIAAVGLSEQINLWEGVGVLMTLGGSIIVTLSPELGNDICHTPPD